jgi:hypothetical protein
LAIRETDQEAPAVRPVAVVGSFAPLGTQGRRDFADAFDAANALAGEEAARGEDPQIYDLRRLRPYFACDGFRRGDVRG